MEKMTAPPMQLEDWLDDLCVRFIINLPEEDLSSVARICFQVEEAQWFYEDFIRPLDPTLPSLPLRTFCLRMFQHCPLLASFSVENHTKAFEEFMQYKTRVPVRGAIMLNHAMDSVVLVKGWKKGANWSFPRGKINKDEDDLDCAVREVYEETGLDLRAAGLVPTEKRPKYIEIAMREQQLRLYVFRDVPMDTNFQPRTRKEISKIQWYKLSELPAFRRKGAQSQTENSGPAINKFYMVAPFLFPLKKWIASQKKIQEKRATGTAHHLMPHVIDEVGTTEDDTVPPTQAQPQTRVPAIETLDGATRELQRLLKVQPPTQGLQQPLPQLSQHSDSQVDKGSALLSMLQSSIPREAAALHQGETPHTPSHALPSDVSQPRNPHHHTNLHHGGIQAQRPPPSFPIPQSHRKLAGDSAVVNQLPLAFAPHQFDHRQLYGPVLTGLGQRPQQGTANPSFNVLPGQATSPKPSHELPAAPDSARLSGASLALLNAFKRGSVPDATPGLPRVRQANPAGSFEFLGRTETEQKEKASVLESLGSSLQPAADQHRSTLLGMFKKDPPDIAPLSQSAANHQLPTTPGQLTAPTDLVERILLAKPEEESHQSGGQEKTNVRRTPSSSLPTRNQIRTPSKQHVKKSSQSHLHRQPPQQSQPRQPRQRQQPQHAPSPFGTAPRILQRGQNINDLSGPVLSQPGISPGMPASPLTPQRAPPMHTARGPGVSHTSQAADAHQKSHDSREQKNQLLSLFGKQQQPPTVQEAVPKEPPRSRISSLASRGGETPISPAEHSFLLDYLQSVTSNAGRS
ncbi:hypothetical protein E4U32_002428 [Claviceps aff. humidiphila group G2b]|nr:hypothetical protein E4U32_002428 [Claviceps aff. humidiphila group G2b]